MTKKKPPPLVTIVLAWIDKNHHSAHYTKARSVIWLREGTAADVERAMAYAAHPGYKVFVYPVDEPNPLERARHDMMTAFLETTDD